MHLLFIVKEVDNEPQGILLLSSVLKQAGHQVSLVVATEEDPLEAALRLRPDVVAYTVYTGPHTWYLDLNQRIRAQLPGVFSIFGGPHPTFFPEMIEREGVDGLCIGEGEYATLDLMNALQRNGQGSSQPGVRLTDMSIPNWWFKVDGEIVRNPLRPLLTGEELDNLPFPDRDLLYKAHRQSHQTKIKPVITGRGCPYDCAFCFNKAYSDLYQGAGRRFRRRSPDHVMRELQEITSRYDVRFILFMDDTFILQDRWLTEFMGRYKAEIGLPFWCQVRANLVTDDKIALFKGAGCVSVSFGLEAGNDRLRNVILNRNMSREEILGAAEILRRHGIAFMTNNMLGLPTGNLRTDFETLELNVQCRPAYANVFLYRLECCNQVCQETRWVVVAAVQCEPGARLPASGNPCAQQRGLAKTGRCGDEGESLSPVQPLVQPLDQSRPGDQLGPDGRDIKLCGEQRSTHLTFQSSTAPRLLALDRLD